MPLFLSQRGFSAFGLLVDLGRILQTRALARSAMEEDPDKSPVNEKKHQPRFESQHDRQHSRACSVFCAQSLSCDYPSSFFRGYDHAIIASELGVTVRATLHVDNSSSQRPCSSPPPRCPHAVPLQSPTTVSRASQQEPQVAENRAITRARLSPENHP